MSEWNKTIQEMIILITNIYKIKDKFKEDIQEILDILAPLEIDDYTMSMIEEYYENTVMDERLGNILLEHIYWETGEVVWDDDFKVKIEEQAEKTRESIEFDFEHFIEIYDREEGWTIDKPDFKITYFDVAYDEWYGGHYIYGKFNDYQVLCKVDNEEMADELYNQLID